MMKKTRKANYKERVYKIVKKIPSGKVLTYGQISRVVGIDPRMVGWALHANKDIKIPCHRVVNKEGRLAPNFAFDGTMEQRLRLLEERVEFVDDMHVNLGKCGIMGK